jgi:streptogramin lyase
MFKPYRMHIATMLLALGVLVLECGPTAAAVRIEGQAQAGGGGIANSSVTLWAASAGEPKQLAQARTNGDGHFELTSTETPAADVILYVVAKGGEALVNRGAGDNPAIAMLSVLGNSPPSTVVINEMTTVASVWTHNQFIDGTAIKGALGLKIAAGNVPSFVDLQTGGWGSIIQDPLNGAQTPTMANFATLSDLLSACTTLVKPDACSRLFAAVTPPKGSAPTDTLTAAQAIARYPWYQPERSFRLLNEFYPVPAGKTMRPVPFMPYLKFPPSAWVLPLKFDGGGYRAGGGAMFDSEGNLWTGDNFTIGWQGQDDLWQGNATKFNPNGKPLSPITTGFAGGGMQGGSFGLAVDANDNAWISTYGGKSIAVFDKNGKPLTPPEGITFDGKLGLMQGIIAAPNGDVWALGVTKSQLIHFPKGDLNKGGREKEPCKSFLGPFHLGIDQQDRIWVTNALGGHVPRFPASDPSKAEKFSTGWSGSGLGIDSQGNVWVTNRFGSSMRGELLIADLIAKSSAR